MLVIDPELAHEKLGRRHLEAVDRNLAVFDLLCDVKGKAQGKRGLPHGRAARHDDEIGRLQAAKEVMKLLEAGREARDAALLVGGGDPLDGHASGFARGEIVGTRTSVQKGIKIGLGHARAWVRPYT